MKLIKTDLQGVFIIENFHVEDDRGSFTKTYHKNFFKENNLCNEFREGFYSVSHKNVIRGMHFQLPPHDHEKLVYVIRGKIIDVILDLRKNSSTYGKYISVELSEKNCRSVYIPKGCAHGFKSLEDNSTTVYNVTTVHNPESDSGIRWDSFGFNWETDSPNVSQKDRNLTEFKEFESINPF
ncbi:dTDP-4-dehydrorhamnose 3,5-epimerase [uncultured Ilyobacter sp.]|uniref:dTDP-4-dehydrorhamnose 3,5-epimerase n=1 Tax=uncultured Ilyobacter sp. TaxID=544433 RepID=UPI002AA686D8|nr:dTDP-4-dehydrorhamnose 3,5-epimerase [uncultured Ilyobacter sp.]